MAKHPFADQARAQLEANGIVFNADGSTSKRVDQANPPQEPPVAGEVKAPNT